jgi:Uma2 family endonuclease
MVVSTPPKLTVEEFFKLHGNESRVDLVRGQVVRYPMPGIRHGVVCLNAGAIIREFVKAKQLGRAMGNDTLIRISADTTRGADVAYVSYAKLPPGTSPEGVLEVAPELVIEVRSPSDLWTEVFGKVEDYLQIGVPVVIVVDPTTESVSVHRRGADQQIIPKDQKLTIPDVLPGFEVSVARFFEE